MKLQALALLSTLQLVAVGAQHINRRHVHLNRRQVTTPPVSSSSAASTPASSSSSPPPVVTASSPASAPTSAPTPAPAPASASASAATPMVPIPPGVTTLPPSGSVAPTPTGPPALDTGTTIPPLANITFGMPTQASLPLASAYTPGATPPISGAPVLPTALALGSWPTQDKVPDTTTPEVAVWLQELDGFAIPDISTTVDGSCAGDPAAAADAANRGWWTCGGYTRDTDITACPEKLTWGVSFDDGPSAYSIVLLNYLSEKDISATFFVVGSRVIERPNVLIEEYMSGHEISVHTWSHRPLTTLTNEQIVAELGWTRKAIKDAIGVTPTTMRPPYGDIDDRVRAISLAMGLIPIMWTQTPSGGKFDTNDWEVAGGMVNGTQSFDTFQQILTNATVLDTGFIVLEHDLFEITVDLAVGYTLNAALTHNPSFKLEAIGECSNIPPENLYRETNTNETFPYTNQTGGGVDINGGGTADDSSSSSSSSGKSSAGYINAVPVFTSISLVGVALLSCLL